MWQTILKQEYSYEWVGIVDGRPIMLVDVEGEKILFYLRTGSGGADAEGVEEENQIKAGQFAPFYGFRHDGWFIKPQGSRAGNYLKVARWLDKNATRDWPRIESDRFKLNREMNQRGAVLTNGIHTAQIEPLLIVKTNIEEIRTKVNEAFKSINTIRVSANYPKELTHMEIFHKKINRKRRNNHPRWRYVFHEEKQYENYKKLEEKINNELLLFKKLFEKVQLTNTSINLELKHTLIKR